MDLNQYQRIANQTANYEGKNGLMGLIYVSLGITGEAGEVSDKVKKILRDKEGVLSDDDRHALALEAGDCLWYVAMLSKELGFDLDTIAKMNNEKLQSRLRRNVIGGSGDNR